MNITTIDQYEAMERFLQILSKIGLKSANAAANDFVEDHEGDWTICHDCSEIKNDCQCDRHGYWDRYDDESFFEE